MKQFNLILECPAYAFLNVITYDDEAYLEISDASERIITVSDLNDMNNKVHFLNDHYVDFAKFLVENEDFFNVTRKFDLKLFKYSLAKT